MIIQYVYPLEGNQIILGKAGPFFYGDPSLFQSRTRAVILPVIIPGAEWEIAGVPERGWPGLPFHIFAVDLFLFSFGMVLGYGGIRSIQKNQI